MQNFTYENTTRIHFGEGQIAKIASEIPKGSKVLVTYGGGSIKKNGVYEQVKEALNGFEWAEFSGIEPNPQYDTAMRAVEKIKAEGFNYLLAVGGGSVLDATKFMSIAVFYKNGDPWEILTKQVVMEEALPIGCILTLPATGSETNFNAVVSRGKDKLAFKLPVTRPKFAVLDPKVTMTLSERQTANGVIDAFVHIMEQYLTYPQNAKVQDRYAESLLKNLMEDGIAVLANPDDYNIRANIMLTATMALNRFLAAGVVEDWTSHAIGHELTGLYGIDHARTLAIILPAVIKVCINEKKEKLLQYGERVLDITEGDVDERLERIIDKTIDFFKAMGMPVSLSDAGLKEDAIDAIITQLKAHGRQGLGEHGKIGYEEARLILQTAL